MKTLGILLCVACIGAHAQTIPSSAYGEMRWRLVGPFRAGWATVAAGVADQPNTFYFGAAGGGVWKTNDAGITWQPVMEHEKSSSVGALAVAPSNPNIVYVGTGQVTSRYDILAGDGIYRSDDAGKNWRHIGLDATQHCGAILIDPENPDRVLVAAIGQAFASNPERGVYLTVDAGKEWKRVLFVNEETGAVDLAQDPLNPSVVYASTWQFRQHPWLDYFEPQVGPGSGIYKSTDRGEHWNKVTGNGLPVGSLGRIGLAVARGSKGSVVYSTVIAQKGGTGFYRSTDGGKAWRLMNSDSELASSYFGHLTVAPDNPEVVYVMGRSIKRTTDGGAHFTIFKGAPGGDDYHFLWINPSHISYMISGADQGATITVNGGESWTDWYNQPTGQFYHLGADDRFPYWIYSGQQDNGTVAISSRGPYGVIEERDWRPTGGEERGFEIPKPNHPEIVIGTGLGGVVTRVNQITNQIANVSPWPVSSYGARPTTVRYHYTWITPLEYSPIGSHYLYFGAQVLFRSSDDGDHWDIVSPDLSGKKADTSGCSGKSGLAAARDCGFGTIFTIAPSPIAENVLWIGTDDGLIHLTTDGCKTWKNVTPPDVPLWGLIHAIAPSFFSQHAVCVAVDLRRLGRFTPLILKTTNDGQTWKTITTGLPTDECVNVVRCDPQREGLLYAGTNRSVYVSFDDGEYWQSLSLNLPTACVTDLLVHHDDLIASTQGRAIWILDNLGPLRELSAAVTSKSVHLFSPLPAWRLRGNQNNDTPPPPSTPLGQNPPDGSVIDYWLAQKSDTPVILTIRDSLGNVVRHFSSDDKPEKLPSNQYFESGWLGAGQRLSTTQGMHRFVWDLRYPRPAAISYGYTIAGVWQQGTPLEPEGPFVLPGRYSVSLNVNGADDSQPLVIKLDPRVSVSQQALREQLDLSLSIDSALGLAVRTYHAVLALADTMKKRGVGKRVADSLAALTNGGQTNLNSIGGTLAGLASAVQSYDGSPTQGQKQVFAEYRLLLDGVLRRWRLLQQQVPKK
jgi:photosystem II stability/assembly factor-like uncharacterized protein